VIQGIKILGQYLNMNMHGQIIIKTKYKEIRTIKSQWLWQA